MKRLLVLFVYSLLLIPLMSVSTVYGSSIVPDDTRTVYEIGVSKELAQHRVTNISNLRYHLKFSIPNKVSDAIEGTEVLRFDLNSPTDIVLDFRASEDGITHVKVGNREVEYSYANEHIIIPKSAIKSGRNTLTINFIAGSQSLNRSEDYMYTLFVPDRARTVFPCFDQPDLKARYTLSLNIPETWSAVGNSRIIKSRVGDGTKTIDFAESEPIPTYLFAFAAGRFEYEQYNAGNHIIGAYYRETDPKRIAQLPEIFRQVDFALDWLEDYTEVDYPFNKYDLVILPGFQFGGMEHTGATFYNDNTIFLSSNPTPDEVLSRANLIAHETSHMWFGDYVTMRWFDDVWTKEVFANYFAAEISAPLFNDINHTLNRLRTYAASAYSEDRTWSTPLILNSGEHIYGGGTSIRQSLDNLKNAGLIYNRIIYNKAPLVMYKIVEIMGETAFRESIREYVQTYAYGNATWDELVAIFDRHTSADMRAFSSAWVDEKGMPTIHLDLVQPESDLSHAYLSVAQQDVYGRHLTWPQSFSVRLSQTTSSPYGDGHRGVAADTIINVTLSNEAPNVLVPLASKWRSAQIIPNSDGRGYGIFATSPQQLHAMMENWRLLTTGVERQAVLMNLHENYLNHHATDSLWLSSLLDALASETDPLTASTIISYIAEPLLRTNLSAQRAIARDHNQQPLDRVRIIEHRLQDFAENHVLPSARIEVVRLLSHYACHRQTIRWLNDIWMRADHPLLSVRDYMMMSYELALRKPSEAEDIIACQHERLAHSQDGTSPNADRIREFEYISRAVIPSRHYTEALFEELLTPEGRRVEPWAARVLGYLNHPLREVRSVGYIRPALEELAEVQRTGDIFFPGNWCIALLGDHTSPEAREEVEHFLNDHPDYPVLLRNKILNGAWALFR